ncbi:MAG: nucleotide sugar dehydrogenase [Rubrobacteraceae bacterium]
MVQTDSHPTDVERVGIVGLGYVGLSLAVAFAETGMEVVGVEADAEKVAAVGSGISYVDDVPSEHLGSCVSSGKLRATTEYEALGNVDAVLICLPTPLDEHRVPDLSIIVTGVEALARHLRPGALVILESTTYPGTTRELVMPILQRSGRRVGVDLSLAFSPERIDPGNREYTIRNTPKVVGGITAECTRRARELYARIVEETHEVSTPESAEMSKLLENTFRGVNIALVNELAVLCDRMGIDVWEVVDAASTKPFGFVPFYPGPGLGGHCIPIDPFYLSWRARAYDTTTEFVELAGRMNVSMPYQAANRVVRALNDAGKAVKGSRVLILGVSYKPNIGDVRESPSLKILEILRRASIDVRYHDPHVPVLPEWGLSSVELTEKELYSYDCVAIATDHAAVDLRLVVDTAPKVVDLRNAVRRRLGKRPNGPLPPNVEVL